MVAEVGEEDGEVVRELGGLGLDVSLVGGCVWWLTSVRGNWEGSWRCILFYVVEVCFWWLLSWNAGLVGGCLHSTTI